MSDTQSNILSEPINRARKLYFLLSNDFKSCFPLDKIISKAAFLNFNEVETKPNELLFPFQGLLTRTSDAVATALDDKLWLGQFIVVLPSHWRYQQYCAESGLELRQAKGQTRYKVSCKVILGVMGLVNIQHLVTWSW